MLYSCDIKGIIDIHTVKKTDNFIEIVPVIWTPVQFIVFFNGKIPRNYRKFPFFSRNL